MSFVHVIMVLTLIFPLVGTVPASAEPSVPAPASSSGQIARRLRFAFGSSVSGCGYQAVTSSSMYSPSSGYGFEPGADIHCTPAESRHRSYCSGSQPFLFSVDVPEGNYLVTVTLGNTLTASDNTIKAESRRLMLEQVKTRAGEFVRRQFTVNVHNFHLPTGEAVALKDRERGSFTWDDKLTLEFNGPHPSVASVEIEPAPRAVTVFLAGDSTVTDQADEPWASWGQMLPRFFSTKVAIANYAESGESLHSFRLEHRREKLFSQLRRGDYLFIQFAHNDQKPGVNHLEAATGYQTELTEWIREARQLGATPVLVTSMHRRTFGPDNKVTNSLGDYPEAMRDVAVAEQVALIDLNKISAQFYEALGPADSTRAFVHYPAHTYPGQDQPLADNTHFNNYGAYELAKCVVQGIRSARLPLTRNLIDQDANFDPAQPDPWQIFRLAPSPFRQISKPAGN